MNDTGERKLRARLLAVAIILGCSRASAAAPCQPPSYPASPESLEQCTSGSIPKECLDTASMRTYGSETRQCISRFMKLQLDRRLVVLKKSNSTQFKKEMRIQADFKKAARVECDRYYACDGTAALLNGDGCQESYITYRARQAQAINDGALEFARPTQKRDPPTWSREARKFARGLCTMPVPIWKAKEVPTDCERLALLDMESANLAPNEEIACGGRSNAEANGRKRESGQGIKPVPAANSGRARLDGIVARHASDVAALGFAPQFLKGTIYLREDLYNRPQPSFTFEQWLSLLFENKSIARVRAITLGRSRGVLLKSPGVESRGFLFKFDDGDLFPTHFVKGDKPLAIESAQDEVVVSVGILTVATDALPK